MAAEQNQVAAMKLLKDFGARFDENAVRAYLSRAFETSAIAVVRWILSLDETYVRLLDSDMLTDAWEQFQHNEPDALDMVEVLLSNRVRFPLEGNVEFGDSMDDFLSYGREENDEAAHTKMWLLLNRHGVDFATFYEKVSRLVEPDPDLYIHGWKEAIERVVATERLYNTIALQPVETDDVVKLAKEYNVDVSIDRTRRGRSLLHAAIATNNVELAQWMVKSKGVSLFVPVDGESGILPCEQAQQDGHDDMISLLARNLSISESDRHCKKRRTMGCTGERYSQEVSCTLRE